MIPLGLSSADRRAFEAQLVRTHELRTTVRLQNLDGDTLADVSDRLLDGQVNIDTTAETDRQLSLTFDDPKASLNLDSDAPADGALYADRLLRVDYGVRVPALSKWVDVPVFCGPIATMQRDGAQVQVSCLGKEHLAAGQCWHPLTLRKGMLVTAAIKAILSERAGESRFSFPSSSKRLPKTLSVGRMQSPWAAAQQLAKALGWQLYYDGAGVCRMRRRPKTSLFTFATGDSGTVLSDPSVQYDLSSIINVIWVKGGKPKGQKKGSPVTAHAIAPRSHALSPWRLGRNGTPRYLVEHVENDHVRSQHDAQQLAKRLLDQRLIEGVTTSFDALPIPHLDPLDIVRLKTEGASVTFALNQASIPLTHAGTMSVGSIKRVRPARGRIR